MFRSVRDFPKESNLRRNKREKIIKINNKDHQYFIEAKVALVGGEVVSALDTGMVWVQALAGSLCCVLGQNTLLV